jgi:serine/threonine protein kinase
MSLATADLDAGTEAAQVDGTDVGAPILTLDLNAARQPPAVRGYRLERLLGQGSYGRVFRATRLSDEQVVAVKLIVYEDDLDLDYLQREIAIHRLIRHPNIVRCYDAFAVDESTLAIVLEYVRGEELFDKITASGYLAESTSREIFRQLVSAIGYLQTFLIVHRDLKPENVMINMNFVVKLTDFGFANVIDGVRRMSSWCGSLSYMSPEVMQQRAYTGPEVDIWSLGIVLYTMVTGKMLFNSSDTKSITRDHDKLKVQQLPVPRHVSHECAELLRAMLDPHQTSRPTIEWVARHPWTCQGFEGPPDFCIPEQPLDVKRVRDKLLAELIEIGGFTETPDHLRQAIMHHPASRAGVMYRLLKRKYKFDEKHRGTRDSHSPTNGSEARRYWTERMAYTYRRIKIEKLATVDSSDKAAAE